MSEKFRKFNSIEQFHNLIKCCEHYPQYFPQSVQYRPKVKLHGTNAAVGIIGDDIFAQQRRSVATEGHYGFVEFLNNNKDRFEGFPDCYIYGEWVGAGIQDTVSCAKIEEKQFCVFAIWMDGYYYADPESIKAFFHNSGQVLGDGIEVIDWYADEVDFSVNFHDKDSCREFVDLSEPYVEAVDKEDPWIKEKYDISGIGEGLVFFPVGDSDFDTAKRGEKASERYKQIVTDGPVLTGVHECVFSRLTFKAKGESHKKSKNGKKRKALELTPEQIKTREGFVETFVTEDRLSQIAMECCNNEFVMQNLGTFLKEFSQDVHKESGDEREANGIEWELVVKPVQTQAREWFITKSREI